ncbi:hypothetical protein HZI73_22355 [Vallitalea pronyensis]|uniref:DUF3168 domain-containing protein n=1 Tax=Vallitalea pronyensis TaxID=1348613 RepID=A0A8J8MNU4_9FIRM|nr:hypothetical protein [Vallitalea pronyensis]QUI24874.1 hypothetical protein HZI73_22355 [Vallitalea pronyensis]
MAKTLHLRDCIISLLSSITGLACYHEQASDAKPPYIVFSLDSIPAENTRNYTLEINLWDKGNSNLIEEKADIIENTLKKYVYTDELIQFRAYTNTRNNVADPKKEIRRRRITTDLIYYIKE